MDLNKLRELAEAHLPVPVETAQIAHETYCPRIGGPVELYDGTCPECGWRYRLSTHSAVSVHPEDLHALIEEVDRLRARLRETAQILITEVGASGPMDAEDAARKAVERMNNLRTLADEKSAEAGLYARRMEQAQGRRDRLQERLTAIERADVDRWKDGYAAAERQIAAWLRDGADIGWEPASLQIAGAIGRGEHRNKGEP